MERDIADVVNRSSESPGLPSNKSLTEAL